MTRKKQVNIKIDKLTNSIENVITGESFETEFSKVISSREIKKRIGFLIGKRNLKKSVTKFIK